MAELKTKPNQASVKSFLDSIADEQKRKDAQAVLKMMKDATGEKAAHVGSCHRGIRQLSLQVYGGNH